MGGKGDQTRAAVLAAALAEFRTKGFDAASMRDIAAASGLSLGAAYYYFRSKDEIVHAYYEGVQDEHEARVPARFPAQMGLGARLALLFEAKLDVVADDRRFLGALFRFVAEPEHPLGLFAAGTRPIRARAIALFARACDGLALDPALAPRLAEGLWLLHLGVLLHFLHDGSPHAERTRALARGLGAVVERLVALLALPGAQAFVSDALARLDTASAGGSITGASARADKAKRRRLRADTGAKE